LPANSGDFLLLRSPSITSILYLLTLSTRTMTPPPPKQPSDSASSSSSSSSSLPLWMVHHRRHQQERRSLTGTEDTSSSRNRNLQSLFQQLHAVDGGGVIASQFAPRRSIMEILDHAIQLEANYDDLQEQLQLPLRRHRSVGSSRGASSTTPPTTSTDRRPTGGSPRDGPPNQDPAAADDLPSKKQ